MTISKKTAGLVKDLISSGVTYQETAKRCGISYSSVLNIIKGKISLKSLSIVRCKMCGVLLTAIPCLACKIRGDIQ